ncbi:lipopeptide mating pheromone precursor Bap3(3) [Schizophyllum commune H4-8]|uniref:Lipopeptide mating pheromone Bap3(3) n=2 Tax=Schizophyllum commune TaxID=5334 RepID=D8QF44_SCHCM|nr:lipopeptide mating pheromone precursor Bap3(3) [Schizophyllum commune H4-8]AAR99651.1 lipopeptide mating pheromone precursor Bap3(3) [Schizophyllum commune]KAI5887475.1 lipopeptide mating pheromone precursor Bap3(3) [Schizophyllum commune H4-8]
MDSFATLPALEDTLLQALLDACAVPEDDALDAMLSSSRPSSDAVVSDAERHGSGNMTYFCVVA